MIEVVDFYQNFYKEEYDVRPILNGMNFGSISSIERNMLERLFSEEEVWKVISSKKGNKAPSLDGFSLFFFQKC